MRFFIIYLFIFIFGFVFSKEKKNTFLGVYRGNAVSYIKEIFPLLKVKDMTSYSYTFFIGHGYIFKNLKGYAYAYASTEKKAIKEFKKFAEKACKKYTFSAVTDFDVKIVELKGAGLLFIFMGNVICLDI